MNPTQPQTAYTETVTFEGPPQGIGAPLTVKVTTEWTPQVKVVDTFRLDMPFSDFGPQHIAKLESRGMLHAERNGCRAAGADRIGSLRYHKSGDPVPPGP